MLALSAALFPLAIVLSTFGIETQGYNVVVAYVEIKDGKWNEIALCFYFNKPNACVKSPRGSQSSCEVRGASGDMSGEHVRVHSDMTYLGFPEQE